MKEILFAGAFALALAGQQTGSTAAKQPVPQNAQAPAPQNTQAIPDAPRPQPVLGPVTPGKGTTTSSNGDLTAPLDDTQGDAGQQTAPGTTLTSAQADAQATSTQRDTAAPPDLPAPGAGSEAFTLPSLRADFVEVPFTVKDSKNHLVPALTWRDVRVYENGLRQQMRVFTRDPFPMSVALVIDQSMPFDSMTRVNNALAALPGAFAPYDEVALFTYNKGVKLETTYTAGQSARLEAVLERSKAVGRDPVYYAAGEGLGGGININNGADSHTNPLTSGGPGSPQGMSQQQVPREVHPLNDAILEAAKSLTHAKSGRRRIIYVISDGREYGSVARTKDVIKFLQTNKIQVFATLTGDSSVAGLGFIDRFHLPLTVRDNNLPAFTNATGGQTFAEYRTKGIETSFSQITEQVRTQYTVGYYSKEPFIDGKFRKLEVVVMRPNLSVIAKNGYYPTAADSRAPVRPVAPAAAAPAAAPLKP